MPEQLDDGTVVETRNGERGTRSERRGTAVPLDRLPPHSVEAERAVLACLLIGAEGGTENGLLACEELGVRDDWFYELRHQVLFQGMNRLRATRVKVDSVTLVQWLMDNGKLGPAGGMEYVAGLPDAVPSAANLLYYLDTVREKWLMRQVVKLCTEAVGGVYGNEETSGAILADLQSHMQDLTETTSAKAEVKAGSLMPLVIDSIETNYHRGHAQIEGPTLGLEYPDKVLCGLGGENGNMVVLSARPSMGKTALATQVALHTALHREYPRPVAIFSMEMRAKALVKRMLFQRAQADMQRFRTGFAEKGDFDRLTKASVEISKAPIYIDDSGRMSVEELCAKARRMRQQHGIELFVIDYIQLMTVAGRRFRDDRVRELTHISAELQYLGNSLDVPLLILAQMNREYEKEPHRKPRLSDLKDCGAIEQDADVVMFLYAPKLKGEKEERWDEEAEKVYGKDWSKHPLRVNLLVEKYRNGMTGDCELLFQKSSTLFLDYDAWRKTHGLKAPAAGERAYGRAKDDMPSNEELGVET